MVLKNQGDLPLPDAGNPVGLPSGSKFMRGGRKPGSSQEPQVVLGNRAARRKARKMKGGAPITLIPAPPPIHVEDGGEAQSHPVMATSSDIPPATSRPAAASPTPAKAPAAKTSKPAASAAPVKAAAKKAPSKSTSVKKAAKAPAKKAAPAKPAAKTVARKAAAKKNAPKKAAARKPTAKKAAAKKAGRKK